jgi:serine/threonine-protein kinase
VAITDPLVLSPDVILVRVAELADKVRARLAFKDGDVALTHPRSRVPSQIVEAAAGELLEEFREPRTVIDAILRFSRAREADPESTLESAFPLLMKLFEAGFLVGEGEAGAEGIRPLLHTGEEIEGFEILDCLHVLGDTELYAARNGVRLAALKIERSAAGDRRFDQLRREEEILPLLDGVAPRLLASGALEGRRWIAVEWFPGVDAEIAARELRRRGSGARPELLSLCRRIAAAYATLHARGILHGDIHARNVLVGRDGSVRLIDFGYARKEGDPDRLGRAPRAGVPFYYEPEYAAALREDRALPPTSTAGEQYAVGVMLYQMAAGAHSRDFSLERDEMLRQIVEEPPLPFTERGAEPWPELEAVLARALRKEPDERFPALAALAEALTSPAVLSQAGRGGSEKEAGVRARVLEMVAEDGPLFSFGLPAPTASVTYGAAGIACGLYRIALAREEPRLLSLADLWAEKAAAALGSDEAYYNPEKDITPEIVGECSAYHTAPGIHAVRALIAHASGQPGVQARATAAFLASAQEPGPKSDVTLGRAGLLLTAALLLDTVEAAAAREKLVAWGDGLLQALWAEVEGSSPYRLEAGLNLGVAHGWAGLLYATLRWCRSAGSAGRELPPVVPTRLAELADLARPWGRGLRWRWNDGGFMAGWCNGAAGYVFLWTLAQGMLGDDRYRALAEGAAWNAWEATDGNASLCCGFAGRAYALLNLHRHGGGPEWLSRAHELAHRAAAIVERETETPWSLYKGALGVAVLAADLARPEAAAMPFFEDEDWV